MNGYVRLKSTDGQIVAINADNVTYVIAYQKSDISSIVYFEKGNYVIVSGSVDEVISRLENS